MQRFQCECAEHTEGDCLFSQIDTLGTRFLNVRLPEEASLCLRPFAHRFDAHFIVSDADEQIIVYIPFISSVKLKSIAILGAGDGTSPAHMKAFINKDDIDFDSVESTRHTQEWDLVVAPPIGTCPEYPTKVAHFTNVRNLTLFIDANAGADVTSLSFIGLKGEFTRLNKDPIITNYELAANPSDHVKLTDSTSNAVS